MPQQVEFSRVATKEVVPVAKVDEEICQALGKVANPRFWVYGWMDFIGWDLAAGKSYEVIRAFYMEALAENPQAQEMLDVLGVLEQHYTVRAFYGR